MGGGGGLPLLPESFTGLNIEWDEASAALWELIKKVNKKLR
jgi:hypothetical protein